jgi:precorrin-6Y C5,15-methyltransferase (decarboxylating)
MTQRQVHLLGIGADGLSGLSPRARSALAEAGFVAGGARHLAMAGTGSAEIFTITNNLDLLAERLRRRARDEQCVVLASGDPLFFGIGHFLGQALGPGQLLVEPAVSSMQLAFARAGVSWHDAAIASVHGRDLESTLLPLLGRAKIGLFSHDGESPAAIAQFFLARGLSGYIAGVGENLGAYDESFESGPLSSLVGRTFAPLNVVVLLRHDPGAAWSWGRAAGTDKPTADRPTGIPDELFERPDEGAVLLTHADVRAVAVSRFRALPVGPIWDLGAGLGGVAVELAKWFPASEVVAVERSARQLVHLVRNREKFAVYNLRVVAGEAPLALLGEQAPAGVFLGGSGGQLDAIMSAVLDRLLPAGVFVANFVGLENQARCLERLKNAGWRPHTTLVQISQGAALGDLTALVPERPVWVVSARRP